MHPCSILNLAILKKMFVKMREEIKVYGYLGWRYIFPFPFNLVLMFYQHLNVFLSSVIWFMSAKDILPKLTLRFLGPFNLYSDPLRPINFSYISTSMRA